MPEVQPGVSYTADNPVSQSYECAACQVSVSGDNCSAEMVAMFTERHKDCEQ